MPYRPRCARPLLHGPAKRARPMLAHWVPSRTDGPQRRGSTDPFDGGLPARSTGAYRPVLAENSALCCFPGARTTENSALCCFPGARTTENSPLESFPGARCHCGGEAQLSRGIIFHASPPQWQRAPRKALRLSLSLPLQGKVAFAEPAEQMTEEVASPRGTIAVLKAPGKRPLPTSLRSATFP